MATGALTPPDTGTPAAAAAHGGLTDRLQEALGPGYQVVRELGAGGFAVVYLVKDLNLKRHLAVKVLSPDLITSKTVLERFRREAETVAQLSHPHIVPLHFIGQKDELLYLAMEYIEGDSLAGQIEKQGRLAVPDAGRIMREVASALEYAHKRGVVHRDIKPHNILMQAESGRVLVTDFGIARTAESSSLTASGMLVGTPAYLSPEQVTGSGSDHRADIYALGVMAYEMVTGTPPFDGPTPTAVLMRRLQGPPPSIVKSNPAVPQPFEDVIMGCLAQDPAERFQTAGEVVAALGGATPVSGGHPTAEIVIRMKRARRRWLAYAGGAAGLVAVAALAGTLFLRPAAAPRVPAGMVLVPAGTYVIGDDRPQASSWPYHSLALDSFAVDSTEVTVSRYRAFAQARGKALPWSGEPDGDLPVTGVMFPDAVAYCQWRVAGGRLPTEEEWEAAARGPRGTRYAWGNDWIPNVANTASLGAGGPQPVGRFAAGASAAGALDMIGNVWEWTSSPMRAYAGGRPLPDSLSQYLVIRGGAYNSSDEVATASYRGYLPPTAANPRAVYAATGFRCVLPLGGGGRE